MTITLKHLSGALAGQEQTFGDDRERVVIGRDPTHCDVVFPPHITIVGRRHMALVRKLSGDYAVDLFGDHYVAIDGRPADPQAAVPSGATIMLGDRLGPTFSVAVDRSAAAEGLSATLPQQRAPSARESSMWARRYAIGAAGLALVAAAGLGVAVVRMQRDEAERAGIAAQLASLSAEQRKAASERIAVADRERLSRSVFAVIARNQAGNERLVGTAWPIRSDLLATNAHVAAAKFDLEPGDTLIARPAGTGAESYEIVQVGIHPGYVALSRFVNEDPLFVSTYGGQARFSTVAGYDVALMKVDRRMPSDLVLTVADPDRLARLAPGDPVAFAGYPYERLLGDDVQPMGRTPQVQVGNVTALTDYFLLPTDPGHRLLIQNNLPATGGGSGSPIIDSSGRVVGLLSAVNMIKMDKGRVPNAALVNYGQRVDVLVDLMEGRTEGRLRADEVYWKRQTEAFRRGTDLLVAAILDRVRPEAGAKAVLAAETTASTGASDRLARKDADEKIVTTRYKMFKIGVKKGSRHFLLVFTKGGGAVAAVSVLSNGKIVARDESSGDPYAAVSVAGGSADETLTVVVETPDADTAFTLRDYVWEVSSS
ncbi:MAG TPA: trypsin-like peptidase domain-containing protein [Beijerinckiaceae bacterium]|jgi:S1-C subfamily serine protease